MRWFCFLYRPQLGPFLDEALSASRERALRRHLARCPACRAHLRELESLAARLRALEAPPVPAGLEARIMRAARARQRQHRIAPRPAVAPPLVWSWLGRGAMVAALLLLVVTPGLIVRLTTLSPGPSPGYGRGGNAPSPPPLSRVRARGEKALAIGAIEGVEWFGAAPPGSVEAAYMALVAVNH